MATHHLPRTPARLLATLLVAGACLALPAAGLASAAPSVTRGDKPTTTPGSSAPAAPTVDGHEQRTSAARAVSPGQMRLTSSCNHYFHNMSVRAGIQFNLARYPNGSYVHIRYAYARVNKAGQQITATQTGRWLNAGWVRPNVQSVPGYPGGPPITSIDWRWLDDRYLSVGTWGRWVAWTQGAIWNARAQAYEYTAWAYPPEGYYNADRFGSGGYDLSCWVSLI
jgi:hypothetical protein